LKNEDEENNDLFELIGSYKHTDKRSYDYEEIVEHMDKTNKSLIDKRLEDRLNSHAIKSSTNLE
jgi:hypothetical protein